MMERELSEIEIDFEFRFEEDVVESLASVKSNYDLPNCNLVCRKGFQLAI